MAGTNPDLRYTAFMPKDRIGLFGGTFDPPHVGHLILASEACAQLALTRLLWVVTPVPPHKLGRKISTLEDRIAMVKLAIAGNASFELSLVEVERPGPHYTLDTVRIMAGRHPDDEIVLLIGGDSLRDLPTWHEPATLVAACDEIGVMHRPNSESNLAGLEESLPGITGKVRFVEAPLLQIASSEIRGRAAAGGTYRYYVSQPVFEYIEQHNLYK
jgi:nicotinate-nucleotide adenylyltransferase